MLSERLHSESIGMKLLDWNNVELSHYIQLRFNRDNLLRVSLRNQHLDRINLIDVDYS